MNLYALVGEVVERRSTLPLKSLARRLKPLAEKVTHLVPDPRQEGQYVPVGKILAWVLAAIVLPGGAWAVSTGMGKLDALGDHVNEMQVDIARIEGNVRTLDLQFTDYKQQTGERRVERNDDLRDIRVDVRDIKAELNRLSIAVERLK